jgi:hypothetical protein
MKLFSRWPAWAVVVAATLAACGLASGKPASPTAEADAVLDRWAEAVGGVKRLKAVRQSDYQMRLTVGQGAVLQMQGTALAGGPYRLVMQTPSGELVAADDGHIGWLQHASLGGRVLDAPKAERERRTTGPGEALRVRTDFPQRRRLPDAEIDGKKVQVLELIDTHGWHERWFFDATTGLRVRRECPDDDKPRTVDYADFRKVDGIVEPFRAKSRDEAGVESTIEVQAVVHQRKLMVTPWQVPAGLEADSQRVTDALRRFEQALGSKEAAAKIKTRVTKTRMDMPANGLSFIMKTSQKVPNRVLVEQDVPGIGRIMQGYDGKTGWFWSEMQGYRELHGPELAQLVSMSSIVPRKIGDDTPLRRIVGESTGADGHRVLAVDLATAAGSTGVYHFDLETGLLVKVETVLQTGPGGALKVTMDLSDYREVDGVRLAFTQAVTNPAMRMVTTALEVKHNEEMADEKCLPRKKGEIPTSTPVAAPAAPAPAATTPPTPSAPAPSGAGR